jgi:hypothetical protein
MKLTAININNFKATLAASACGMLLLSGVVATKAVAQDRLAMLSSRFTKTTAVYVEHADADTNLVRKSKPVVNAPSFDLMGSSPLDESLVMDFAAKKKLDAKANTSLINEDVYPKAGWNAFEKYVNALAIATDGITGNVQLSFVVSSNGSLDNFKVVKGICESSDNKAIELVKNGPSWVGNSTAPAKEVTVTVKFHTANNEPVFF